MSPCVSLRPLLTAVLLACAALPLAWAEEPVEPAQALKVETQPAENLVPARDLSGLFPMNSELFEEVHDSFHEVDKAMVLEWEPSEAVFDALNQCTQAEVDKVADLSITYQDLSEQPATFRGKVVSVQGVYRRVAPKYLSVTENWFVQYYRRAFAHLLPQEANWFQRYYYHAADHLLYPPMKVWFGQISYNRTNIVNFISLEPVPAKMVLDEGARVSGVFLKRYAYLNNEPGGKGVTWGPLILIKQLNKQILGGRPLPKDPVIDLIAAFFSILIAGALFAYVYGRWKNKQAGVKYFGGSGPTNVFPGKGNRGNRIFGRR